MPVEGVLLKFPIGPVTYLYSFRSLKELWLRLCSLTNFASAFGYRYARSIPATKHSYILWY